mgnify:CR=1
MNDMEFYYLPKEYQTIHTACFDLVRQIEEFIVKDEYQFFLSFAALCTNKS